jgi:hypothetical protein
VAIVVLTNWGINVLENNEDKLKVIAGSLTAICIVLIHFSAFCNIVPSFVVKYLKSQGRI